MCRKSVSMNYPTTRKTLLEKIKNGDEIYWNEFYNRYAPIIKYVGRLYNFSETECDDLVQNVMLKFFNQSKNFTYQEGKVKFRTYFSTIVRSQAIDYIRKNKKEFSGDFEISSFDTQFETMFMEEWKQSVLNDALDELRLRVDPITYQAFELYGLQSRDPQEVAAVLGIKKDQLYVAKSRCSKILRETISRIKAADEELDFEL